MDPWVEKQERREMKKTKKHLDMVQYTCDAEYGIPRSCPCGGRIVNEVSANPKDKDFSPGRKYFTCDKFEDDGLHFRQPWVIGVEEEVRRLRKEVDDMAAEIAALKLLIPRV
ncbi:uncharacterized protein LOC130510808 [Raphanus sativus]|uniref:Uncharacterized protein LOC130494859 n=1 Tax=Raphanus sativus TaxID=3726 RepID=A0A9W3DI19_RAPSA|nr:uncharacterized protein LOC130494859 [Raphanus sativus]XP_056846127.1 uncharacterized protein LOC130497391 [Raphanus sativus]XP_056863455.1 uncharacterized protein LOC130510808 [Raphanus sativus]